VWGVSAQFAGGSLSVRCAWVAASANFVEEAGGVGQPRIAVDGQGDALAVWQSEDGKLEGGVSSYTGVVGGRTMLEKGI
jgi:hypothetical protein